MNILTFDIEEWFLEKQYFGAKSSKYALYDSLLDEILDKLEETSTKGTFFCVGGMATDFAQIVKKIASKGHEIGCHSHQHEWLNKLTYTEVLEDTKISVDSLEQCIGQKVKSYRAPAFSIGKDNKWVFEILAKCGIERDASVFPASRDFGGFLQFGEKTPTIVDFHGVLIKEFPICTTTICGKEVAYSGGGYFRFFPYSFIKKEMSKSEYSMTYFHLGDLYPVIEGVMSKEAYEEYFKEQGTLKARLLRYLKINIGVKASKEKLFKLIEEMQFVNLEQADNIINWQNTPKLNLNNTAVPLKTD